MGIVIAMIDHTGCNGQQKAPFGKDHRAWWSRSCFQCKQAYSRSTEESSQRLQETPGKGRKLYRRLEVLYQDKKDETLMSEGYILLVFFCSCHLMKPRKYIYKIHPYYFWNVFSTVCVSVCLYDWAADTFIWIITQRERVLFSSLWAFSLNTISDGWISPIKHYIKERYIAIIVITSRGFNWYMMMNLSLLSDPWKKSLWIKSERAVYQTL